MTTLQRGICLGCVLVAVIAAIATGLLIDPQDRAAHATPDPIESTTPASSAPATTPMTTPMTVDRRPEPTPTAARNQAQSDPSKPSQPTPGAPPVAPPAQVEPLVYDFGVRNPNELVWTKFTVSNPTNQTLFIREVKPACKCTVPTLDSKVIPPGGEINIDASLDLRGHLGDARKNFNIFFEGYAVPIECVISGVLSYPVQITPNKPKMSALPRDLSSST